MHKEPGNVAKKHDADGDQCDGDGRGGVGAELDIWFNDPSFGGCIFINAASEFPNPNDPAHQAAAEHKRAHRDDVRKLAKRAGAHEPDVFADRYTALLEGTLVPRHVHGRNDAAMLIGPAVEQRIAEFFD